MGLRRKGFSRSVIERVVGACRNSTQKTYQSAWKTFLDYLSAQGIPHNAISVPVVCDFLDYFCTDVEREYRTLAVYKCALRHPLLWACDIDIEGAITEYFMRGVFNYRPPQKTREMPKWSLDLLLRFLKSKYFEPLETAHPTRLTQKALFLILLASGRRKGEVANLSRESRIANNSLSLFWIPGFLPKHHTPEFQPECPSVSALISSRETDRVLCPVRAYKIYLERSQNWLSRFPADHHPKVLWSLPLSTRQASAEYLSDLFRALVGDSRRFLGEPEVVIGMHQVRKLAASHALQEGQDEQVIKVKMGFSEVRILRKNYIAPVPRLKVACVLPGGTFIPDRTHELSDSDSD